MPRSQRRRPQDEEHIRLLRSCHEELGNIRQAIQKSTELSSAHNATIILLTIAVFLTGFIAILRDFLTETFRPIIDVMAATVMLLALYGAYLTTARAHRISMNSKKEEVTASSSQPISPPSQPIASTPEDSGNKEQSTKEAFRSLITPMSIILTITWLALFSYLQVASINPGTKDILAGWYLRILTGQILIFMGAIIPVTASYFVKEYSPTSTQILQKLSYALLVISLFTAPAPLLITYSIVANNFYAYIIYLVLVFFATIFLLKPVLPRLKRKA